MKICIKQKKQEKTGFIMTNIDIATEMLREFIRIDTSNPPGNEEKAILFLENILQKEGLSTEIYLPVPKRANIISRIEGKKKGKPVILLGHVDVVPANADEWDMDPFGGDLKDGFIYGRGAIDMKGQIICQLLSFIDLYKEGIVPERDIIFLATCDEEVGGKNGLEYMLNQVRELRNASFVLSEGGCIINEDGSRHAQISVDEKQLSQFMLKAAGVGGHGSKPHKNNANEKIVNAAKAILSYDWPFKPTNIVNTYMNGILKGKKGKGFAYTNLKESLKNKYFRDFLEDNPSYNALLRNTVTLTILKGGDKVNVIPATSQAYFDARLLPTENHEMFFKKIKKLCGDNVEIELIGSGSSKSVPSGYNNGYFNGMRQIVKKLNGPIPVLPFLMTGASDLRYFRNLGILSYGFFPATFTNDEFLRMHGKNERISVEALNEGLEGTNEIVKFLASHPGI
jgi:acetylornithine deacetylase/succinyl-diaminopimelate desuccinylase-like protein